MPSAANAEPESPRAVRAALAFWLLLFGGLLALELVCRVVLPDWPHYRGWNFAHRDSGPFEARGETGMFFANLRYEGDCYGDLAFVAHTPTLRVPRHQVFTTDGYGYRNPPGWELGPWYVLALGDSMVAGAGLTDADTFCVRLQALLGEPVYNAAGRDPYVVVSEPRTHVLRPRFVLLECVERFLVDDVPTHRLAEAVSDADAPPDGAQAPWPPLQGPPRRLARARTSRAYSAATHYGSLLVATLRLLAFREVESGIAMLASDGRTLLSLEAILNGALPAKQRGCDGVADTVAATRDWFAARGVQLVYVLVPDKSDVYRELVPPLLAGGMRPQGEVVRDMQARLEARGVPFVDVYGAFREARAEDDTAPLYWPDDTHWSPRGARVAAQAVARRLAELSRR